MFNLISASLTTSQRNDIKAHIQAIQAICTFLKNLTPKDRQKLFKMGSKSMGFVKAVLTVMKAQPAAVPASFNVAEFEKDFQLYLDLKEAHFQLMSLNEGMDDTLLLLGSELMKQATAGYRIIRLAAKGDMALDTLAADMGVRFKRGSRSQHTVHTLPAKEKVTLHGVVPKRLFKTLNQSPLTLYRGDIVAGKGRIVGGNSNFFIPTNWTTITIVNEDAEKQSVFSLIQK